ncbi:MAG TPA: coniferyl aldehyde dehydrogenase [Bryobacteraceae bacterium]|jgi:acyl-CoA reductase-like NAD-dependent aldehyde dehydrogenase|nr:coniferyl aldehyde dehydrogenase [Bryobacteraceae bacterium]
MGLKFQPARFALDLSIMPADTASSQAPDNTRRGNSLRLLLDAQRAAFARDPYPTLTARKKHLRELLVALIAKQKDFTKAIDDDFGGRAHAEIMLSEVFVSGASIKHALRHAAEWMRARSAPVDLPLQPARAWVMPQPLGVAGIISPWNYPLFLFMGPLAGALAAGNRAMLKPSEYTPATSALLARLIEDTFAPDHVAVVNGDAAVAREFATLPFDHLLFTGSTAVGREVMRAASENLTPVTLELGGKCPAILAPGGDVSKAARDILYGKLLNAGQTCVAPDYVLVPRANLHEFAGAALAAIDRYFPNAPGNPDYTALIHPRHVERLQSYLEEASARGVEILPAARRPPCGRKFAPALLLDPPGDLRVMREEIFGPVLPLKAYDHLDEALAYVNALPRPLALYLFTRDRRIMERVERNTISGALSVNETLLHCGVESLPFGGVGASGMGHYHGRHGFETFSKMKPVFYRPFTGFSAKLRPPYGKLHERLLKLLMR